MNYLERHGLNLKPGDKIYRKELHAALGGQTQSGISPSSKTPVVMLFSDPASGEQHGYIDEWHVDGYFHYTGEGQRGDQEMARGNKALRDHEQAGRELYLFRGSGKGNPVTLVGRFRYFDHLDDDGPDFDGLVRKVLRFRLEPVDLAPPAAANPIVAPSATTVDNVPIEQHMTERMVINPSQEPTEAERRESDLVQR
jgi:hypothetical protein